MPVLGKTTLGVRAVLASIFSWCGALAYGWCAYRQPNAFLLLLVLFAIPLLLAPFGLLGVGSKRAIVTRSLWWAQVLLAFVLLSSTGREADLGALILLGSGLALAVAGRVGFEPSGQRSGSAPGRTPFAGSLTVAAIMALADAQFLLLLGMGKLYEGHEPAAGLLGLAASGLTLVSTLLLSRSRTWGLLINVVSNLAVLALVVSNVIETSNEHGKSLLTATTSARSLLLVPSLWAMVNPCRLERARASPSPVPNPESHLELLFGSLAAVVACWILLFSGSRGPVYSVEVEQALDEYAKWSSFDELRVHGILVPGSVVRLARPCRLEFRLRSESFPKRELQVRYASCEPPDSFRDGPRDPSLELSVQGRLSTRHDRAYVEADMMMVYIPRIEFSERHDLERQHQRSGDAAGH